MKTAVLSGGAFGKAFEILSLVDEYRVASDNFAKNDLPISEM